MNFMNNMSQEQMRANLNMMNPEMMKNASSMLAGMSDSQIQMYLTQMGMPGMDPKMFRSMCQNMSNMSDSQFNSMKNMAQSNLNNMNNNNNNNNAYNNSSNTNINSNNNLKGTIVEQVTKMKEEGNNLFRDKKYEEAIKKYYETIEEIKTSMDKEKYKNELNDIERSCRLNISACKLKTKDYDGVINECSIVLETNKCFKAYHRMGLALFHKQKYDKAFRYLDNANAIGNQNEKKVIEPDLRECKEKLDEMKKKEREERLKKEKEREREKEKEKKKEANNIKNEINEIKEEKKEKDKTTVKEININNENRNEIKNEIKTDENKERSENKINNEEKYENKDDKLNNLRSVIEKEKEKNKKVKEEEDDIKIEDTKEPTYSNNNINNNINYNNINNFNYNNNFNNINNSPKFSQEYINEARNQMNNMTDEQLREMIENMKRMDNQTMKNLMAAQGMNLSDQQINMMKNSLSPELLRMVQNQNFQNPNMNANGNINSNNINNTINTTSNSNNPQQQMSNLGNMDFSQMMEFIKKNPELLKMVSPQLSQMMGGKNVDPELMMKSMENILWIFSIPSRIKKFMLSWRGVCLIIFIIAIFYGIFKR